MAAISSGNPGKFSTHTATHPPLNRVKDDSLILIEGAEPPSHGIQFRNTSSSSSTDAAAPNENRKYHPLGASILKGGALVSQGKEAGPHRFFSTTDLIRRIATFSLCTYPIDRVHRKSLEDTRSIAYAQFYTTAPMWVREWIDSLIPSICESRKNLGEPPTLAKMYAARLFFREIITTLTTTLLYSDEWHPNGAGIHAILLSCYEMTKSSDRFFSEKQDRHAYTEILEILYQISDLYMLPIFFAQELSVSDDPSRVFAPLKEVMSRFQSVTTKEELASVHLALLDLFEKNRAELIEVFSAINPVLPKSIVSPLLPTYFSLLPFTNYPLTQYDWVRIASEVPPSLSTVSLDFPQSSLAYACFSHQGAPFAPLTERFPPSIETGSVENSFPLNLKDLPLWTSERSNSPGTTALYKEERITPDALDSIDPAAASFLRTTPEILLRMGLVGDFETNLTSMVMMFQQLNEYPTVPLFREIRLPLKSPLASELAQQPLRTYAAFLAIQEEKQSIEGAKIDDGIRYLISRLDRGLFITSQARNELREAVLWLETHRGEALFPIYRRFCAQVGEPFSEKLPEEIEVEMRSQPLRVAIAVKEELRSRT